MSERERREDEADGLVSLRPAPLLAMASAVANSVLPVGS
jgi:hypothetical protein